MSFKTRFPNGGPNDQGILNSFYSFPGILGNVLFVDSGAGATGNGGTAPDGAKATMIQGQTIATASNDDVVMLVPGHTESVVGAAGMTFNKAGVTYQGLGRGRVRPTITFSTSTAAQIIVSAANVTFKNIIFDLSGIDAIVAAFSITGADVAFEDCEFIISNGTAGVVKAILTAATATRFRVERCDFIGPATSSGVTTTACISHEAGVDYLIKGCYFTGKMTQAILNAATILRGLIDGNRFVIATGTVAITMAAASTPFIVNNRINVPSGTAPIVCAAGFVVGNIYSAAAGVTAGTASTF